MSENTPAPSSATLTVFRLAGLVTFLAVAMGSVVCATKSGASCPTWPGCRPDDITPGWHLNPVIEFSHRVVAVSSGPLVLAAAVMSARTRGVDRWVRIAPWVALAGAIASGAFGRMVVVSTLPTWLGGVDLFCALTAMTVTGIAAVRLGATRARRPADASGRAGTVSKLAAASVGTLIVMHVTGIFAAGTASYTRCMGWPLWRVTSVDLHPWLQGTRLGLAGLGALLILSTVVVAVRSARLRPWGIAVAVLFAGEMVFGVVIRAQGIGNGVASTYSLLAVALLSCLGLLSATAGAAQHGQEAGPEEPSEQRELTSPGPR